MKNILDKSISALEGWVWQSAIPAEDDSWVEYNFYQLHKKPLRDYTPGDVNFMLMQQTGLPWLMPMAIDMLERDLFVMAEYYEGDLLITMLLSAPDYWQKNRAEYDTFNWLVQGNAGAIAAFDSSWEIVRDIKKAVAFFNSHTF